ncbi:hypothetical protein ABZX92_45065, partial [Lentzea sp. NPDC006480]|uniref:hypothetical protein n=1 Tax=Lentzea sp. NPDC006480 TaxID=3157176 RepID=UPI0033A37C69
LEHCSSGQGRGGTSSRLASPVSRPQDPVVVTTAPSEGVRPGLGSAPDDLLDVDWQQATLTAEFCGVEQPVTMANGEARATSTIWGPVEVVVNPRKPAWFGDLDADGRDEAAVNVHCENGGHLTLAFGLLVVRSFNGTLELVGEISTTTMRDDSPHVPLLADPRFEYGAITVRELWYRPSDAGCCPTGVAQTRWSLRDGTLKAAPAVQVS